MNFEKMIKRTRYLKENPEGMSIMCKAMEDMINETKDLTLLDAIRNLMANLKLTVDQAMVALGVPEADRGRYAARL